MVHASANENPMSDNVRTIAVAGGSGFIGGAIVRRLAAIPSLKVRVLTRNPEAFVSALRRLGAQNLAEEHPSKLVQWLFYSHPPLRERIDAAQTFLSR